VLHYDLKELVLSIGGYRYVVFAIDEYSRFVFVEFIKLKSDADAAIKRCIAAFNATVGTPIDEAGQPLPRPTVRAVHGDRERASSCRTRSGRSARPSSSITPLRRRTTTT
jgi:hypothetical protein